jgi:hypothetical protein
MPNKAFENLQDLGILRCIAGVAQLVERQLPKLNVASSNLVTRSKEVISY